MPTASDIANAVQAAGTWDARVALIRRVPEEFGTAQHASVYAAIAKQVYVPDLKADFAYVHWRDEYELAPLAEAYGLAHNLTDGFLNVAAGELGDVLLEEPQTLSVQAEPFPGLRGLSQAVGSARQGAQRPATTGTG